MELAQADNGEIRRAGYRFGQQPAILHHVFAAVLLGETEIQFAWLVFGTVGATHSSAPRAERVEQPGGLSGPRLLPCGSLQELDAVGCHLRGGCRTGELRFRRGIAAVFKEPAGNAGRRVSAVAHKPCDRE